MLKKYNNFINESNDNDLTDISILLGRTLTDVIKKSNDHGDSIIFVVDEKSALNIITSLSKFVDSFTIEEFLLYRPSINLIQLLSPFKMKSDLVKYNAIQIKMNTQLSQGDFSVYDQWIKLLENFGV